MTDRKGNGAPALANVTGAGVREAVSGPWCQKR